MREYWRNIKTTSKTLSKGLSLTLQHLKDARKQREPLSPGEENYFDKGDAIFTVQYPREVLPVPTVGRYKLHNEIEDCIVCDKCAKICPVDCIEIEPLRSVGEFGKTSDGTSKRIYAAKFDIDMAKCCFCGLCTTVCPTECLTMTDDYDFSTFDIKDHNFEFGNMTPIEILQKKKELEAFQKSKEADKSKPVGNQGAAVKPRLSGTKPSMPAKPLLKPNVQDKGEGANPAKERPKMNMKPKIAVKKPGAKPVIKPKSEASETSKVLGPKLPKPKGSEQSEVNKTESAKKKPIMKPKMPPKKKND